MSGADPRPRAGLGPRRRARARGPTLGVRRTTPAASQGPALGRLGSGPPGWDLAFTAGTHRPKEPAHDLDPHRDPRPPSPRPGRPRRRPRRLDRARSLTAPWTPRSRYEHARAEHARPLAHRAPDGARPAGP